MLQKTVTMHLMMMRTTEDEDGADEAHYDADSEGLVADSDDADAANDELDVATVV